MSDKTDNVEVQHVEVTEEATTSAGEFEKPVETITPKPTVAVDETEELAKNLNLTGRRDLHTGKPILPSTPAMRAAAAARARKKVFDDNVMNIESYVIDNYGEHVVDNVNIKLVIATLSEYVKRMGPNTSVDETLGGDMQAKLANLYDIVLGLKPDIAQTSLEIIVAVIKNNLQGAFELTRALRFANTMPLNGELSLRFQLLTTLFINIAKGTSKKDLAKTINIRQLLEYIPDRNAKANISEFIN